MHRPCNALCIEGRQIGDGYPAYFIADIAANHDGDLGRAKELIFLAKEAGADAAKFQHFRAASIVSDVGFRALGGKSHQASWKKSVFEVYQDASVSLDWTTSLKETCAQAGITFFTSPYDFELVDAIDPYVSAYKVGSGDITWIEIIRHIASKGKPYLIATGASSMDDVQRAVNAGLDLNEQLALLQCNTNYTGSIENMRYIQLNVLKTYRAMYPGMVLGLSDHTPGCVSALGAIALGGKIIEKHFTDDVGREGPDHKFSMCPKTWKEMVERTRELEAALGGGVKKIEDNEQETAILQRRAICARKTLQKGHQITAADIEVLRPCPSDAFPPYKMNEVVGKKTTREVQAGEHLGVYDLQK